MSSKHSRILISALGSDEGKTTLTIGLCKIYSDMGINIQPLKHCSDFIDAAYHTKACGNDSINIDPYLTDFNTTQYLIGKCCDESDLVIMEGAMGYYDGLNDDVIGNGCGDLHSPYDVANKYGFPVILIIDGRVSSNTLAAMIHGIHTFRENSNIKGIIFNRVIEPVYNYYKKAIEKECNVEVLGYIPYDEECKIENGKFGLKAPQFVENCDEVISKIASLVKKTVDVDRILEIASTASVISYENITLPVIGNVKIAVAKDSAFCFYYNDSLRLLEKLGAELIYFSPLKDSALPECDGVIFGGGFPEKFADELAGNTSILEDIRYKVKNGLPCYAEGGGFMYLHEYFIDKSEKVYNWVGIIQGTSKMSSIFINFGYVNLKAVEDTILCNNDAEVKGQEYHFSTSTCEGKSFIGTNVAFGKIYPCINSNGNTFAGFPHINFWSNISFAKNFIKVCYKYQRRL